MSVYRRVFYQKLLEICNESVFESNRVEPIHDTAQLWIKGLFSEREQSMCSAYILASLVLQERHDLKVWNGEHNNYEVQQGTPTNFSKICDVSNRTPRYSMFCCGIRKIRIKFGKCTH